MNSIGRLPDMRSWARLMMLAFVGSDSSSTSFWNAWMFMTRIWIVSADANWRTWPSRDESYIAASNGSRYMPVRWSRSSSMLASVPSRMAMLGTTITNFRKP